MDAILMLTEPTPSCRKVEEKLYQLLQGVT